MVPNKENVLSLFKMKFSRCLELALLYLFSFGLPLLSKEEPVQSEYSALRVELHRIESGLAVLKKGLLAKQVEVSEPEFLRPLEDVKPVAVKPGNSMDEFKNIHNELDAIARGLGELREKEKNKVRRNINVEEPIVLSTPRIDLGLSPIPEVRNKGIGFYVLPFFGVLVPDELEWYSVGGDFEIEEENGYSSGVRMGYGGKYFFSDFQVSYFHNEMESMDIGLPGLSFSGKTEGMGGHISAGAKIPFSQSFNITLGGGLGGTYQDVSFRLMGITVEEEDLLFSYQLFTGIEYYPTDYLRLGLRYRWLCVEEMDLFAARDLHLAELALGYVF